MMMSEQACGQSCVSNLYLNLPYRLYKWRLAFSDLALLLVIATENFGVLILSLVCFSDYVGEYRFDLDSLNFLFSLHRLITSSQSLSEGVSTSGYRDYPSRLFRLARPPCRLSLADKKN